MIVALAVVVTVLPALPGATTPAAAANAADFDPGYIVSDENFYNGGALDAGAVQLFIASKNPGCYAGTTCLLNYTQNTPSMAATSYCQAMPGIANESAASIIARVGAACNISQKALLVILQKEQSLVTLREASASRFNKATGFACPDTAPCDPAYAGFFYQIYNAARQFNIYKIRPQNFNHQAGQWNAILWHPNAACGRVNTYIRNAATAGLYNYTPYRPNDSALANMYGTGDGCASYGNRNFWRLWTDWFGPTTGTSPSLAQVSGSSDVWLLGPGVRYRFGDAATLARYSAFGTIRTMTTSELGNYYWGGQTVQKAVATTDGRIWLIDVKRYAFQNCEQLASYGMTCGQLPVVASTQLNPVVSAGYLQHIVRGPDGANWFVQNGTRREMPDTSLLVPFGIPSTFSYVSESTIAPVTIGPPLLAPSLVTDGAGGLKLAANAGYAVPPAFLDPAVTSTATRLTAASFALVGSSTTAPSRMTTGGRFYLLTTLGWLDVNGTTLGSAEFVAGTDELRRALANRTTTSTFFVREQDSAQVYLVGSNGLTAMNDAAIAWYSSTYGVSSTPWVVPANGLDGLVRALDAPVEIGPGTAPNPGR
ncbi:hypothetical protein [Pseudolysinimonas yzui]|uniref:Uncharacterized protein n=1 Tax=Pseudolysinimonas yzui TaxID=2708254 RepID=A0A8J3GQD9_9MICO|nr:hypothetical protein [Pseudolysinimonas yzui]GHF15384.1 hypothetical protein GCM10011600_15480 [Pseudolysinimonas yzui]